MDTIRITVPLTIAEAEKLIALAKRQRRKPRDQAAFIIAEKLREVPQDTEHRDKPRGPQLAGGIN